MVTVKSKDPCPVIKEPVQDCFKKQCEVSNDYEQEQDYIKSELRILE